MRNTIRHWLIITLIMLIAMPVKAERSADGLPVIENVVRPQAMYSTRTGDAYLALYGYCKCAHGSTTSYNNQTYWSAVPIASRPEFESILRAAHPSSTNIQASQSYQFETCCTSAQSERVTLCAEADNTEVVFEPYVAKIELSDSVSRTCVKRQTCTTSRGTSYDCSRSWQESATFKCKGSSYAQDPLGTAQWKRIGGINYGPVSQPSPPSDPPPPSRNNDVIYVSGGVRYIDQYAASYCEGVRPYFSRKSEEPGLTWSGPNFCPAGYHHDGWRSDGVENFHTGECSNPNRTIPGVEIMYYSRRCVSGWSYGGPSEAPEPPYLDSPGNAWDPVY